MSPKHLSDSGTLFSYGGDPAVIATRGEIDRVMAELGGLEAWLRSQIELPDFAADPAARFRLAIELPPILERLSRIRDACGHAADSYFEGEVEISRELREGPVISVAALAAGISGLGSAFGVFGETKVSADMVAVVGGVQPPSSIGTLAMRLTELGTLVGDANDGAILRIEKFREPASPVSAAEGLISVHEARYVVYIPGTQEWGPTPGTNPFDLTSNLGAISKTGFAGSERAVALAMQQAGISPDSPVLFVGHSQGGMIAANLSRGFSNSRVLTFGSPIGAQVDQLKATTLSVEHVDDPVPRLDARPNALAANWVTVRQEFKGAGPLAQHEMKGYLRTAQDIDLLATEPGLVKIRGEISSFAGSPEATGQAFSFELKREP
jgi:hypothetical protein